MIEIKNIQAMRLNNHKGFLYEVWTKRRSNLIFKGKFFLRTLRKGIDEIDCRNDFIFRQSL